MDKTAETAQHALEALGAAEGQLARFIGLFRPPGNRVQAYGSSRLIFLAADGGLEFCAKFAGAGIEKHRRDHQNHGAGFYIQGFNV